MPRYVVTATMDVGYLAVIEADNEEEAYKIADKPTKEQAETFHWMQTDNGHDWTLESTWEVCDVYHNSLLKKYHYAPDALRLVKE
tara:strand:+ start:1645 stop:1899 length:255 start_codon:yes stop_codon:yes gene_type:complete